jgi:type I restriction enzyme S subunit
VRKGEATIAHLPGDQLKKLKFVLPPLHEQHEIATYLDRQYAAVNEAIGRKRRIIDKLIEYRQSLIHAAVTGRIDCTKEPL